MYTRALRENGDPRFYNITFCGDNGGSNCPVPTPLKPAFPNTFSGTRPPGVPVPPSDVVTIAPDFESMYAIHSNVQLEQALTDDPRRCAQRHLGVARTLFEIDEVGVAGEFQADERRDEPLGAGVRGRSQNDRDREHRDSTGTATPRSARRRAGGMYAQRGRP